VAVKFGLPPVARSDARLFILGSLPGDASLAARRYYAHPTNQFWKLLGQAIGEELHALPYAERLDVLAAHRIGLWDVVASAERADLIVVAGTDVVSRFPRFFERVAFGEAMFVRDREREVVFVGAQAVPDLLAGRIQMNIGNASTLLPLHR